MAKHTLHHQAARIAQARKRWDASIDDSDRDLVSMVRASRKLHKAAMRIQRRAELDDFSFSY
jgi:hypothetical protein